MKARLVLPTLFMSALSFGACGDKGDEVSYETIAPGSECISGGVRLIINGEGFTRCNGDANTAVTTERVPRGTAGNPCLGDALRTTIQTQGQDPAVAWTCSEPSDDDIAAADPDVIKLLRVWASTPDDILDQQLQCVDESLKAPLGDLYRTNQETFIRCAAVVLADVTMSDEVRGIIPCIVQRKHDEDMCNLATEDNDGNTYDYCDGDNWNAIDDCEDNLGADTCYDDLSEEADRELNTLSFYVEAAWYVCPHYFGF